ncbi:MAG TPA: hypothetical protein DIT39_05610 [Tissierellales bacterium]|jgi:hypothetical protein|nr:zinc ribbon domain-containing protein [Gudongella oleilytica]HCO19068.1 hypothetical protein [Tissierellales bacterium]
MYCTKCGSELKGNESFCTECGAPLQTKSSGRSASMQVKIGYSDRISDPAFSKYLKNTSRWSFIFSLILALIAIIGFYIYGETSNEMDNPQALYIGFGIAGMFLLISLYSTLSRKRSKTWDGVVVDKEIMKKSRQQSTGSGKNDYYIHYYTEYSVTIREDKSGKTHKLTAEDDDTQYNYYNIGDKVRHHGGLNSYEKYDKSNDDIIFCNACATLCDIKDDTCWRCSTPLLK